MFKRERDAIVDATAVAKDGINLALVISVGALLIATAALAVAILKD
jgi:hypothetical protein